MNKIEIVSMVAIGTIGAEIDLEAVSQDIDSYSCRYNPNESPGLYVKFHGESPTITVYRTGSFNIRGASTEEEVKEGRALLHQRISDLGIDATISNAEITNIVCTGDLDRQLNLNKLAIGFGLESVEYEPEQFPGLVYRLNDGVALIFSSGKLVLTGFTEFEEAQKAYDTLAIELDNG